MFTYRISYPVYPDPEFNDAFTSPTQHVNAKNGLAFCACHFRLEKNTRNCLPTNACTSLPVLRELQAQAFTTRQTA